MSRRLIGLSLLGGALTLIGCAHRPQPPAPPTPEVTVSLPIEKKIQDYEDFSGRIDAIYYVDIRARVNGYLVKVYFKDGAMVKEGEKLYEIDPRPYQADLDKAKGMVEKYEGQKKYLDTQVERYTKLVAKGAASQQELDSFMGQQAENLGSLASAKAQVEYARLNLNFCTITAPITGQISRTYIQIGNLITADSTLLTTLVSTDPMYAYFNVEETTYLRIQGLIAKGVIKRGDKVQVRMGLADDVDRKFPLRGTLDFFNNQIDPLTGTMTVRGIFENHGGLLKTGLFARVRVPLGPLHPGLLVAEKAIGTDQGQKFVYVVNDQNKVEYRRIKVGQLFDELREVLDGLKPGERIIVNGLQRVRPDVEVKFTVKPMPGADDKVAR
jgi:RND family efflux transporter MFP subunit